MTRLAIADIMNGSLVPGSERCCDELDDDDEMARLREMTARNPVLAAIERIVLNNQLSDDMHQAILRSWQRCPENHRTANYGTEAARIARALTIAKLGRDGMALFQLRDNRKFEKSKPILLATRMTETSYNALSSRIGPEKASKHPCDLW